MDPIVDFRGKTWLITGDGLREVAKPIAFLLSDAASDITGQHLGINGGAHMAS